MPTATFSNLSLHDWRQFRSIDIDFHKNLTVITGPNGAGKTSLLNILNKHFGWSISYIATPKKIGRQEAYRYFSGAPIKATEDNPFATIGEIAYTDGRKASIGVPALVGENFDVNIYNALNLPGIYLGSHRPVYSYARVDTIPTKLNANEELFAQYLGNLRSAYQHRATIESPTYRLKGALISLATFGYGNKAMRPNPNAIQTYEGFQKVLRIILPKSLGFKRLEIRMPDVVFVCETGDFSLDAASGGIAALIDISWQIYMRSLLADEFIVVADEPENHLHPALQRSVLPSLVEAFPQAQFIVATHNPFVVNSVPDSHVYVLGYQGKRVVSKKLDSADRSGSADKVLSDVLGVALPLPLWVEERIKLILRSFEGKPVDGPLITELKDSMDQIGLGHLFPKTVSHFIQENDQTN